MNKTREKELTRELLSCCREGDIDTLKRHLTKASDYEALGVQAYDLLYAATLKIRN